MSNYTVRTRKDLRDRLKTYKSTCHPVQKHRAASLKFLEDMYWLAIEEFENRSNTRIASKRDLWSELSNYNKDATSGVAGKFITKKIRAIIEEAQHGKCCYCRTPLLGTAYAKPIEHILPRKHFIQYTFHFYNLAVACYRCNDIKSATSWAHSSKSGKKYYPRPESFVEMFHPGFHYYEEHIIFDRKQNNTNHSVTFLGVTDQGKSLCLNLLSQVAAREMLLSNNISLAESIAEIKSVSDHARAPCRDELEQFEEALATSLNFTTASI